MHRDHQEIIDRFDANQPIVNNARPVEKTISGARSEIAAVGAEHLRLILWFLEYWDISVVAFRLVHSAMPSGEAP